MKKGSKKIKKKRNYKYLQISSEYLERLKKYQDQGFSSPVEVNTP